MKRTGFFLAAALIGVLLFAFLLQPKEQSWTLPDGSVLQFAKVTWGTNQVYRYGHRPMDLLYPLIPARYRSNFNFQVAKVPAPPPGALVVWFKRTRIPTNATTPTPTTRRVTNIPVGPPPATAMLLRASEPYLVSVVDEFGVESRTSSDVRVGPIDNSALLAGVVFSSYPRRAKSFSVRIHWSSPLRTASSGGSTTLLGEFRAANPADGRRGPVWTPEPLPATHRTNGLELTMVSLETGLTVADALRRSGWQSQPSSTQSDYFRQTFSLATFVVLEGGVVATNWGICRWILSDAAGERHPLSISPTALLKPAEVVFADSLWLDEPAWKLEVELERTAGFPVEEIWTIKGLPLPVAGQPGSNELVTNLNGANIRILDVVWTGGSGGFTPNVTPQVVRLGPTPPPPNPGTASSRMVLSGYDPPRQLAFNLQAPDSVRLRLIEVRDERGQAVTLGNLVQRPVSSRGIASPGTLVWLLQFTFPADSKTADLTIAVSPRRIFEFCVKPTLANANSGPVK